MQASTLIDLLQLRASQYGAQPKYANLDATLTVERRLSFVELYRSARKMSYRLCEYVHSNDRVLLVYTSSLDFLEAFFACLYVGAIPVPVCPPRPHRPLTRLSAIARDAGASVALVSESIRQSVSPAIETDEFLKELRWCATDTMPRRDIGESWVSPAARHADIAFIQYTSGTTSTPRGVVITHENILSNCEYMQAGFVHDAHTVAVTWLPYYHDMGLIAGLLQPLYIGHTCYTMLPGVFIQQPIRWLRAMSRFRADHSGAPPFAYQLCCDKVSSDHIADLDLQCWRTAYVGAEPIQADVLDRFSAKFASAGFRATSYYPAYGLAEATLKVTGGKVGEGPIYRAFNRKALENNIVIGQPGSEATVRLTGCGRASHGTEVRIVDAVTRTFCREGTIGEIWVRGPGVASEYWGRASNSEAQFRATLSPDDNPSLTYLRTGDLGLLLDGILFVTGRRNDMIIINGRNIYPQDIECTALNCCAATKWRFAAAFSVEENGDERLVLVQEVVSPRHFDGETLAKAIRAAIVQEYEVSLSNIVFVNPGTIPRTTSGKVQRQECRSQYAAGLLLPLAISSRGRTDFLYRFEPMNQEA